MKILIVADEESKALYDYYDSSRLKDIDLILSCGDLRASYLEFLVTMGRAPVLYVMGNHDDRYKANPPEGCVCVEERVYNYKGLRIAGLGGCMRYKPDGIYLYTEAEAAAAAVSRGGYFPHPRPGQGAGRRIGFSPSGL